MSSSIDPLLAGVQSCKMLFISMFYKLNLLFMLHNGSIFNYMRLFRINGGNISIYLFIANMVQNYRFDISDCPSNPIGCSKKFDFIVLLNTILTRPPGTSIITIAKTCPKVLTSLCYFVIQTCEDAT